MTRSTTTLHNAIRGVTDPTLLMQRVVDQSQLLVGAAEGAAVELVEGDSLVYVCTAGSLAEHVGIRLPVMGSLSGLSVRTQSTLRCDDTTTDDRVNAEACRKVGAISMVCVPLRHHGEAVGVLKVTSSRPHAFGQTEVDTLTRLAGFITEIIASAESLDRQVAGLFDDRLDAALDNDLSRFVANVIHPGIAPSAETRRRIEDTLERSAFQIVYQPIFRLDDLSIVGHEALSRFGGSASPDVWFTEAHRVGLGVELEFAAVAAAADALPHLPTGTYLALNAGPELVTSRALLELVQLLPGHRLVIELTEHVHIDDYPGLLGAIAELRNVGVRLAIDDTGTGYSGLAHILQLDPDIIKLDRILTTGIDHDPARRALATALVSFATDRGACVIAEGIETADELATIRELGIGYGQGYHLGRPTPIEH